MVFNISSLKKPEICCFQSFKLPVCFRVLLYILPFRKQIHIWISRSYFYVHFSTIGDNNANFLTQKPITTRVLLTDLNHETQKYSKWNNHTKAELTHLHVVNPCEKTCHGGAVGFVLHYCVVWCQIWRTWDVQSQTWLLVSVFLNLYKQTHVWDLKQCNLPSVLLLLFL